MSKKTTAIRKVSPLPITTLSKIEEGTTAIFAMLGDFLSKPQPPATLARIYLTVDKQWKKIVEATREGIREKLLEVAREAGGSAELEAHGQRFKVHFTGGTRAQTGKVDTDKLMTLLTQKSIDPSLVMDEVKVWEVNPEKMGAALLEGKLTEDDIASCRRVVPAALHVEKL